MFPFQSQFHHRANVSVGIPEKSYYQEHGRVKYIHLKTIARLSFLSDNIENGVDELSSFCVVALSPVVSSTRLTEDEIVRSEDLTEWARSDRVHGAGLKIDEDGSWNIFTTSSLIVVDVDALKLEIGVALVASGGVDAVLVGDHFPELKKSY